MFPTSANPCPSCGGPEGEESLLSRLSKDQRDRLVRIRSALGDRAESAKRAEHHIRWLTDWLLDDEQKAALASRSGAVFELYAACCLKPVAQRIEKGLSEGWLDPLHAERIRRILRLARRFAENRVRSSPSGTVPEDSIENMELAAGALSMAEQLDLRSPKALDRIRGKAGLGAAAGAAKGSAGFEVEQSGPHPHLPGTLRVRVRCRDAALHRGLKQYETETDSTFPGTPAGQGQRQGGRKK